MPTDRPLRAALYARVSTTDQTTENQILELRRYAEARGWTAADYLDTISGTKERRPALDRLMTDAKRRRFDVLVVWRLDRLRRNLKHLIVTLGELAALGVRSLECRVASRHHEFLDIACPLTSSIPRL